jgi:hypothetical protein
MEETVGRMVTGSQSLQYLDTHRRLPCRWFVLKQGKIFWFKSDVVTPVSAAASRQQQQQQQQALLGAHSYVLVPCRTLSRAVS